MPCLLCSSAVLNHKLILNECNKAANLDSKIFPDFVSSVPLILKIFSRESEKTAQNKNSFTVVIISMPIFLTQKRRD
jgi:hypothetical protein